MNENPRKEALQRRQSIDTDGIDNTAAENKLELCFHLWLKFIAEICRNKILKAVRVTQQSDNNLGIYAQASALYQQHCQHCSESTELISPQQVSSCSEIAQSYTVESDTVRKSDIPVLNQPDVIESSCIQSAATSPDVLLNYFSSDEHCVNDSSIMASEQPTNEGEDHTDSAMDVLPGVVATIDNRPVGRPKPNEQIKPNEKTNTFNQPSAELQNGSAPTVPTENSSLSFQSIYLNVLLLGASIADDTIFAAIEQQLHATGHGQHELRMEDDHDDVDFEWPQQKKDGIVHSLQATSMCVDSACEDCSFWKELKIDLENSLRQRTVYNKTLYRKILSVISEHSCNCSEIYCVVPYCCFFNQCESDEKEEQIARLVRFYTSADMNEPAYVNRSYDADENDDEIEQFIQIEQNVVWNSIEIDRARCPKVRLDYDVFEMEFGQFGKVVMSGQSFSIPPEFINIHQYTLLEDVDHDETWSGLRRLGQHENIVRHHWVYWNSKLFTVCFDYAGSYTLQDIIYRARDQLTWNVVGSYTRQLLSAVQYLHRVDVLYLLWTASSISLAVNYNNHEHVVKLADFTFAIHCPDDDDRELGNLMAEILPPNIVAPEMFLNIIGKYSDVWGIGCLMYEMINGFPLHHNRIHQSRERLRGELKNCKVEDVRRETHSAVLHRIFTERETRINCRDLFDLLSRGQF